MRQQMAHPLMLPAVTINTLSSRQRLAASRLMIVLLKVQLPALPVAITSTLSQQIRQWL
jgi:hypothetical protein